MNPIPLPYRILAVACLWLVSLVAVGWWQHSAGVDSTQAKWESREATQQVQAASQIKALEESARAAEQKHAADMASLATDYERKIDDAQKQRAADIAAVRAGDLRLRDPGSPIVPACPGAAAQAGPGSGGGDGSAPGGLPAAPTGLLSGQTSEWLVDFAADADDVARQLASCQQVITEDRR